MRVSKIKNQTVNVKIIYLTIRERELAYQQPMKYCKGRVLQVKTGVDINDSKQKVGDLLFLLFLQAQTTGSSQTKLMSPRNH
jgi:hypothetical protein